MPLDANIILQARGSDLSNVVPNYFAAKESAQKSRLTEQQSAQEKEVRDLQISQAKFKNLDDREKSRFSSTIYGAAQLRPYLESGNIEGAKSFLSTRKANLEKRIAAGENVDTTETDEAIALLDSNPDQLKDMTNQIIGFGQQVGILKSQKELTADVPSSVREFSYYQNLDAKKQKEFLNVKRNLLGEGQLFDAAGNAVPISGYNPNRQATKQAEAFGTETGKQVSEKIINQPKAESALNNAFAKYDNVVGKIDSILPRITPATAGFAGAKLSKIEGTKAHDLKKDIDTIVANLGFEELQQMRDNSPTGGALGNVVVRELELLQSTKANLENSQSAEQLKKNALDAKKQIIESKARVKKAYDSDFGRFVQQGGRNSQIINNNSGQPTAELELDWNNLQ